MSIEPKPLLSLKAGQEARAGIFLSGSGTNAERVLEYLQANPETPLKISVLVTDAPKTSRANELGKAFGVPVVGLDIREYYASRGEKRVSIATAAGQKIRQEWTDELRNKIKPYAIDFAIFAGFVPLTNLTEDFPCLNVHPGDLTYTVDGRRLLVGLHTVPIERAILERLPYIRSSVIIAQAYTGKGGEMDSGPVLGISGEVPLDLGGHTVEELEEIRLKRPALRPKGGFGDALEDIAAKNQDALKVKGDWVVLPRVVADYACGRFALDEKGVLYYRIGAEWHPVETVIYEGGHKKPVLI